MATPRDDAAASRAERVEEITRIVLQVLEARGALERHERSEQRSVLQFLTANWVVILFVLSLGSAAIGWLAFNLSPFHAQEEAAFKQSQNRITQQKQEYRLRMIKRHLKLANSFLNVAELEGAKEEFEKVLKLDQENIAAHFGLMKAEVFQPIKDKTYDPEAAEMRLRLIQEERPEDPHVDTFLGMIYLFADSAKAERYFRAAIEKDQDLAQAYHGIGMVHDLGGNLEASLEMYFEAWRRSEWNQDYLNNLAYQYLRLKRYDDAIEKYWLLISLDARYLLAYYTLSNAYQRTGNLAEARRLLEHLVMLLNDETVAGLDRNSREWFFHTDKGRVHFFDLASKQYYAYWNLAMTAFLLGDEAAFEEYTEKASALGLKRVAHIHRLIEHDARQLGNQQQYRQSVQEFLSSRF